MNIHENISMNTLVENFVKTSTLSHPLTKWQQYRRLKKSVASKNKKRAHPLLVTGTHRSGSTWIGNVIEKSDDFIYLNEPTSLNDIPGSISTIEYWFQYIQNSDEDMVKDLFTLNQNALSNKKRALFKDPLAFFSIDTFIDMLEADILISVRHPAAFVSSLKRLGWSHDFNHFLEQEALMETYLYPFRNEVKNFAKNDKDIIDQGILLWNIINLNTLKFKQKYPQIYTVKHEDLSMNPLIEFQKIFDYFEISLSSKVHQYILDTTNNNNTSEAQNNVTHQLHRDSKENIYNFKNRLTNDEIAKIRKGTEMISHIFYDKKWWEA